MSVFRRIFEVFGAPYPSSDEKRCGRCKATKPIEAFYFSERTKDHLSKNCRDCFEAAKSTQKPLRERVKNAMQGQKQVARQHGTYFDLTVDQWIAVLDRSDGYCYYCRQYVGVDRLVIEHVIPISRGGGTTIGNVVPACRACNGRKGNRDFIDFAPD